VPQKCSLCKFLLYDARLEGTRRIAESKHKSELETLVEYKRTKRLYPRHASDLGDTNSKKKY